MAERRRSAHAGDDQNNGGTLSAKKPRDPQSSYLYRSVVSSRQQQSSGKTSQGASRDYSNQRRHDDRQGQHHPHRSRGGQGTSMNTRQRAPPRNANAASGHSDARFCPGCGNSPHNRTECRAWGKICFKCEKRNHFANVCRSTTANTNLVVDVEQPLSQTDADLSVLNLYNTNTQHRDSVHY